MVGTIGVMPRRKKQEEASTDSGAKSEPIRVEQDIAKMATQISIRRGLTVSEVVSPMLRPLIEAEYRKVVKEMYQELSGDK